MVPIPPALLAALLQHGASVRLALSEAVSPLELGQLAVLANQHNASLILRIDGPVNGDVLVNIAAAGAGHVTFDFA